MGFENLSQASRKVSSMKLDEILIGSRLAQSDPDRVLRMADSLQRDGLQTPIKVRPAKASDGSLEFWLVYGLERLEAAKLLGWERIDCFAEEMDDRRALIEEITENLRRKELTALERSEQTDQLVRLHGEQASEEKELISQGVGVSGHNDQKPPQGGRPKGGDSEIARNLGLDRKKIQRSREIAGLTPEAKQAARETGLDDDQNALLEAAKANPDQQEAVVRLLAEQRPSDLEISDGDTSEDQEKTEPVIDPELPASHRERIIKFFCDEDWHHSDEISEVTKLTLDEIKKAMRPLLASTSKHKAEQKKAKGGPQYRIFSREKSIPFSELKAELTPRIKKLHQEGRKRQELASPAAVLSIAGELDKLIRKWGES